MKRIIASAGLVALGAASLQAAYAPGLSPLEQSKPWTIGLALRGFYDDNYTTSSDSEAPETFGLSVSPYASINKVMDQTLISLSYKYELKWYEDRPDNEADHIQLAKLRVNHAFSERFSVDVADKFIYAQEGTVETDVVTNPTVLMTDADYVRNVADLGVLAGLTEKIGLSVTYQNQIFDYEQDGVNSRSATLDRIEHLAGLQGRITMKPEFELLVGYQYGIVDHTHQSNLLLIPIAEIAPGTYAYQVATPDVRNVNSHYLYAGVDYTFNPQLQADAKIGAMINDFTNADEVSDAAGWEESSVTPWFDARLTWTYNPGSYLAVGVVHTLNQTDVSAQNQESTSVFATLSHRITPKLTGNLRGHFQYSAYDGSVYDGEADMLYMADLNLNYAFNANLSAEAGYVYDNLNSDIQYTPTEERSYSRNRFYIGLRAAY
jgi:predicted porin